MYEKAIIIGNVGKMDEKKGEKYLPNGTRVFEFSLAVNQGKNPDGTDKPAKWVDCKIWKDANEGVRKYITQGQQLYLEGTPDVRAYKNAAGEAVAVSVLHVHTVKLLGKKGDNDNAGASTGAYSGGSARSAAPENSDDIPF